MHKLVSFNKTYGLLTLLLFVTELLIAKYLHDALIRPYGGDFLVVILIYCFIKTFLNTPIFRTAIAVLLFSFLIEFLQYLHIVNLLGLAKYNWARIIIGTSFSWTDILSYILGILTVLGLEYSLGEKLRQRN